MGVGVPSTRAQAPTVLPHPTMEYNTQASCLISASSKTIASLMRTPGPIRARGPIETLGPSLAVGSTDAEGWIYTGGRIFADGFASSSDCAWNAFVRYRALAGTAEPAVLICLQKSLVSRTKNCLLSARSERISC